MDCWERKLQCTRGILKTVAPGRGYTYRLTHLEDVVKLRGQDWIAEGGGLDPTAFDAHTGVVEGASRFARAFVAHELGVLSREFITFAARAAGGLCCSLQCSEGWWPLDQ
jgi:hypothetical protein